MDEESAAEGAMMSSGEGTTQDNDTVETALTQESFKSTASVRKMIEESLSVQEEKGSSARHHMSPVKSVEKTTLHATYATTMPLWLSVAGTASAPDPFVVSPGGGASRVSKATSRVALSIASPKQKEEADTYEGDRDEQGRPHGQGVMTYRTNPKSSAVNEKKRIGNVYTGQWVHGKRHGQGRLQIHPANAVDLVFAEATGKGGVYTGQYQDDVMCGEGRFQYNNSAIYVGSFRGNKPNGVGKLTTAAGDVYTGLFVDGKREGQGECIYANADTHRGEWKSDKRNGNGFFVRQVDGVTFSGMWRHDKQTKDVKSSA
jgi:hypothetical protein